MKTGLYIGLVLMFFMACKQKAKEVEKKVQNNSSDWITLFDGSSYENWRGYLKDSVPKEWTIEEDVMVFTPSKEGGKNLITKQKFTNFILSLEWKISEGGNSGVFWGISEDRQLEEPYLTGPEIQVLDNQRHPDAKANPKYHQAGALYDMVQPEHDVCKPAGEWNHCVLEINHNTNEGKVILNGKKIVSFPVHGDVWNKMVENSKFKDWEYFGKYHTGHIGLQDHGDKVCYKNIKIKKIE